MRYFADPGLERLRSVGLTAATAAVAIVGAFALVRVSGRAAADAVDLVVLAILLSISFTRERAGATLRERARAVVMLPLVGLAAGLIGALMLALPAVGDSLYVLVISGSIWVRRYGPTAQRLGTLVALPFVAVLVAPLPVRPTPTFPLAAAAVAALVVIVGGVLAWAGQATGLLAPLRPSPTPPPRPQARDRRPGAPRRLPASTRMAVQMAASLTAAFIIGHLVFGVHWPWLVLTAFIVSSGNRGRADVFYKGVLRVAGALGGTVVGSVVARVGHRGDPALLVAIAAVVLLALWLRPLGYAWWAAGVTAALALLYDFAGTSGGESLSAGGEAEVLLLRLVAIVAGGLIASLSAGFLLPVKTVDVVRMRTAEALAALSAVLAAVRETSVRETSVGQATAPATEAEGRRDERAAEIPLAQVEANFAGAVARLEQVAPALRAHRRVRRSADGVSHPATLIGLIGDLREPISVVVDAADAGALDTAAAKLVGLSMRRVGELRRALGGRDRESGGEAPRGTPGRTDADSPARAALVELLTVADRLEPEIIAVRRPPDAPPDSGAARRPSDGRATRPADGRATRPPVGPATRPPDGPGTRPPDGSATRPPDAAER
ncbi:FUSC family protein [Frondihabitans australicus]|uniref:Fusaric acid resistance family protein n=1 Tax=Frondihabitans australicus TaxID=386892 RepID=A0A495IHE1_9MICO|nr:FUSC family protein [Frondihabitans australicus]RKR74565.1 fusaric acid resistance family protein [Frondihabitans australicus]